MSQQTIITLIVAYTCVVVFVFTAIVTLLSLVGWIEFARPKQQNKLFYILIVEIVGICVGIFGNFLKFDVKAAANQIEANARLSMDPAAEVLFCDGHKAFSANNFPLAESKFAKAAEIDPNSYMIRLDLGVVRLQLERYTTALPELLVASDLFDKQPKEQQAFSERIVITSSLIAGYSRNKDFVGVRNTIKTLPVTDVGDSLCALYVNASDGMFQAANWTDAADYGERARMIAVAFELYARELSSLNSEANALYNLPGNEKKATALLEEGINKAATYPIDQATKSSLKGYLLNTRGLFKAKDMSVANQEAAIVDYTSAIQLLTPLVQLQGDNMTTLASAYGNRADAYARLKRLSDAQPDRKIAINYFIQLSRKQGVSSQLSEIARELVENGGSATDAFAAITVAIRLGADKPANDRQADEDLLASVAPKVSAGEQAAVQQSLSSAMEQLTQVSAGHWQTFGLP